MSLFNVIYINISPSSLEDTEKVMLISSFVLGSLSDTYCPGDCQPPSNFLFILLETKSIRKSFSFMFDLYNQILQLWHDNLTIVYLLRRKTDSHWYDSKSSQAIQCCENHFNNLVTVNDLSIKSIRNHLHQCHLTMKTWSWTVVSKANCCQCNLFILDYLFIMSSSCNSPRLTCRCRLTCPSGQLMLKVFLLSKPILMRWY